MKNRKVLLALALIAIIGIVGSTVAYFTSSATFNNEFTTGTYSTTIVEEFESPNNWTPGTTTNKKVNVKNNGSVEVAVRAKYTETWTAADGSSLSGVRNNEPVAQFVVGNDWEAAEDGYYYYKDTLATGETSSDFLSSVTFNPKFELVQGVDINCTTTTADGKTTSTCTNLTSGYLGAKYTLSITLETIQADQKWTYTPIQTMINFTIDSTAYQAPLGWTWENWLGSSYSQSHYAYDGTSYVTSSGCPICYENGLTTVGVTDPLENGENYVSCP